MTKPELLPEKYLQMAADFMPEGATFHETARAARAILYAVEEERERNGAYRQAVDAIADADPVDIALDPSWPIRVAGAARREVRYRREA